MSGPYPCQRCRFPNAPTNAFCAQCGAQLQPATAGGNVGRSSWATPLLIIIGVFAVAFIGILTVALFNPEGFAPPPAASANAAAPPPSPTPSLLPPAEVVAKAKQLTDVDATRSELGQAVDLLSSIPKGAKEYKEAQPLLELARKRWARLAAEDLVLGPKPDNAGWNGKVYCVDHYLKRTLNDYDSAEYLEWSPVTRMDVKREPYWAVRLKLRAKNAFGALIIKDAVFFIRQNEVVNAVGL